MSAQFDKVHATTVIAAAAIAANRFVTYEGKQATTSAAAAVNYVQGVAEEPAAIGEAVSVVTGYSYLVEAGGTIAAGAFVKPDADGKAVAGAVENHCGHALAAAVAGQLVEVRLLPHIAALPFAPAT